MELSVRGRLIWVSCAVALAFGAACGGADPEPPRGAYHASPSNRLLLTSSDGAKYLAHEVIVKPVADVPAADFAALVAGIGAKVAEDPGVGEGSGWAYRRLILPDTVMADDAISQLMAMGVVETAERNYMAVPLGAPVVPNDPRFGELWGLAKIQAAQAWQRTTGSQDVVVAISDSGIDYRHPDLAANIWTNPGEIAGNGIDDDKNGYVDDVRGWDWFCNENDPMDETGHGTHVAGTVGAVGSNAVGVTGVNWKVKLAALRFLGSGGGTLWSGASTVVYAARIKARVVNASWGCTGPSCYASYMQSALAELNTAGGLFVAAAGNNYGNNNDSYPIYPANYMEPNVLAVAATDGNDVLANFSNYGPTRVHLAAPGVSILSTLPNGQYGSYQGTSMAAPHVAGVAALLLSLRPSLTVAELHKKLLATTDKVPSLAGKVVTGGRLNALAAASSFVEPPPPPSGLQAIAGARNDVTLQWAALMVQDLGGYRVHWGTAPGMYTQTQDVAADKTTLTLANLVSGTTYYFAISSVDRFGSRSGLSAEVSAAAVDLTAPPQVVDLTASAFPGEPTIVTVASASGQYSPYWAADKARDGNPQTAWVSPARMESQEDHLELELTNPTYVDRVELLPPAAYPEFFPADYDIEVSLDGQSWTTVGGMRNTVGRAGVWQQVLFPKVQAARVRLRIVRAHVHASGYAYAGIGEIVVREVSSRPDGIELRFTAPGDDPGQGTATSYEIRYSDAPLTNGNFAMGQLAATRTPAVAGTTEIVMVQGMGGGRTYHFALRAIDDAGNASAISNIATVAPLAVPPGAVTDLRVAEAANANVTLTWTAPGAMGGSGNVHAYELRRSLTPINAANFATATLVAGLSAPAPVGGRESFVVQNVAEDVEHYFALRAFDDAGTAGPVSNVVSARLTSGPDVTPPATVEDLAIYVSQAQVKVAPVVDSASPAVATSQGAARLIDGNIDTAYVAAAAPRTTPAWVVLDLGDVHPVARVRMNPGNVGANLAHYPRAFEWQGSADKQNWQTLVKVQAHDGSNGHWDSWDMQPTSTRYLRMYVTERGVAASEGASGYVWLGEIEVYAVSRDRRLDLTWVAPGDDGFLGTAVTYDLRHSAVPITDESLANAEPVTTPLPAPGGLIELLTLPPLNREGTHHYRVRALDEAGNTSAWSNEAVIDAPPIPPAAVSDLAAASVEREAIELTFTAQGDDGAVGTATAYELRYGLAPITPERWHTADTIDMPTPAAPGTKERVRVTGLRSNTRYHFALKVVDDIGLRSLPSNMVSVETSDGIAPGTVADLSAVVLEAAASGTLQPTSTNASGAYTAETGVANLFDGKADTVWISPARNASATETVDLAFAGPTAIHTLRLLAAPGYEDLFPASFRFQVRNDESQPWQTVVEESSFTTTGGWEEWALGRIEAQQARLEIIATNAWAAEHFAALGEVELLGDGTSSSQIQLRWTAPGDDGSLGQAAGYDVRRSNTAVTAASFAQAAPIEGVPAPKPAGSLERLTVGALAPKATYCFALRAKDEVGLFSEVSNGACATTAALPPATVTDLRVTAVDGSTASLAFTAPGAEGTAGTNSSYDVRVSLTRITAANWDSSKAVAAPTPAPAGTPQTVAVTGLQGVTTYYFAVRARNSSGVVGGVSNNAQTKTLDNVPPNAVTDLAAQTLADIAGGVRVTFTAPGDNGPVGQAQRYDVRVSTQPITAANFADAAPVSAPPPRAAGNAESVEILNLGVESAYYVAMRAIDLAGNVSALSNVVMARTREEAPSAIVDLTFTGGRGTEDTHLMLRWTAPGDNGRTGTAASYQLRYGTQPITSANFAQAMLATAVPAPAPAGTVQTHKLAGLVPDTKYYAALVAVDARGNKSLLSNVAEATTPDERAPSAIVDLGAATATGRGSIQLTWTAPGDDATVGKAQTYELRHSTQPITEATFAQAVAVAAPAPATAGSRQSTTVAGLADEAMIYFALRAKDNAGNVSALSNIAMATTGEVAPAAVTTLAAIARGTTTVTLRWTASGDNGNAGTAASYDLRVSESLITDANFAAARSVTAPTPAAAGTQQTVTAQGFQSTRVYYFALKVIDGRGNVSPLSNVLRAETVDEVAPAAILDLAAATGSGAGSIVLTFTAPGDDDKTGKATSYDLRQSNAPITTVNFAAATPVPGVRAPNAAGTAETITINNLKGETTYHFAIRAVDDEGLAGGVAPSASASTRPVPPAAISTLAAVAKPGSAVLTWTAPGDDGNEGQAVRYDVRMSTQAITPQNFDAAAVVPGAPLPAPAGTQQTLEVANLAESKTYHFAIKTIDKVNAWSALSNVAQATTPDVTAPAAPANLSVRAPEPSDALLVPTKAEATTTLGPAWDAKQAIDGNGLTSWASAPSAGKSVSFTVELEATKDIDRVRALPDAFYPQLFPRDFAIEISVNKSTWETVAIEEEFSVKDPAWLTWGFAPRKARYVRLTAHGLNSSQGKSYALLSELQVQEAAHTEGRAVLSWVAPGDNGMNGVADKYEIYRSTQPFGAASLSAAEVVAGAPTPATGGAPQSFTVGALDGETTYHWALRAVDKAGNAGPLSIVVAAQTNAVPPAPVDNLQAQLADPTSAKLTWTAPGDDFKRGRASSYELRTATHSLGAQNFASATQVTGLPVPKAAGAPESFVVTGLQAGKVHRFALIARDEQGHASYVSNVAIVATPAPADVTPPDAVADLIVRAPSAAGVRLPARAAAFSTAQAPQYPAAAISDGNKDSAWASLPRSDNGLEWVRLDLGDAVGIGSITLWPSGTQTALFPTAVEVAVSKDGLSFAVVGQASNLAAQPGAPVKFDFAPQTARYVEVRATSLAAPEGGLFYAVVGDVDVGAAAEAPGTVYVGFTAPADDGASGRVARYDVRAGACPFDATKAVSLSTPPPQDAGAPERFRFTGLAAGPTCFAVRSADAADNLSAWSTVVEANVP